jgi:hypothetical protein
MSKLSSYNLKNVMDLGVKLGKNLSVIFSIILVVILVLVAIQIKNTVKPVISPEQVVPPLKPAQGVRINFTQYREVVNRLNQSSEFRPSTRPLANPFNSTTAAVENSPSQ